SAVSATITPGADCYAISAEPEDGKEMLMFHGTTLIAARRIKASGFKPSKKGMLGAGVYLSPDIKKAERYPIGETGDTAVLRVKVNVGKVITIDRKGHPQQTSWHDHGYDSAWCPPNCGMVKSGCEEYCVRDPKRILMIEIFKTKKTPADGKRYLMYHGTSAVAAAQIMAHGFKPSADGMLGRGVYLSRDLNKASRYPLDEFELKRVVLRVVVNVGRVKKIDYQGHPLQTTWHDHGYDTAWCPPNCGMVPSGLEEDCVWDPKRIQVIGLIYPAVSAGFIMWAEDDSGPPGIVCLQSLAEPIDKGVYLMYHGTSRSAAEKIMASGFKQSKKGMLGRGVYLSRDLNKASRYPLDLPENQRVVLRLKVNVGRVKKIDRQGHPLQKSWHDHGYDTAWCPPNCGMVPSGLEEDCVWDPNRIQIIDAIYPTPSHWLQSYFPEEPAEGRVYRMYHGTSRSAAQMIMAHGFKQSAGGMLGRGVYLSRDLNKASRYPLDLPENQRVVLRVKVNVGKVKKIDRQYHPLQKSWHDHGYDTAWCPPGCGMVKSGLEEDCVWDPNRIQVIDAIYPRSQTGCWNDL
uniref:PARP catalytic domain-containing protein n=1 Tax=Astyanax mexicanus TaxID=7994 RepID=W5K9I8_ASTMX